MLKDKAEVLSDHSWSEGLQSGAVRNVSGPDTLKSLIKVFKCSSGRFSFVLEYE